MVIVVVQHRGEWLWFRSDPEYWILDQRKWVAAFRSAGFQLADYDFSERFDIPVVDQGTVDAFVAKMASFSVSKAQLAADFLEAEAAAGDWLDVADALPVLFVDFDNERLWSLDSESSTFEECVPDGWRGEYEDFLGEIPMEQRYWFKGGRDLLSRFLP